MIISFVCQTRRCIIQSPISISIPISSKPLGIYIAFRGRMEFGGGLQCRSPTPPPPSGTTLTCICIFGIEVFFLFNSYNMTPPSSNLNCCNLETCSHWVSIFTHPWEQWTLTNKCKQTLRMPWVTAIIRCYAVSKNTIIHFSIVMF